jgi:hypothetical protein
MRLSSEARELRDLVRGFLQANVPSEYLRDRIAKEIRVDEQFISTLNQLGLHDEFGSDQSALGFFEFCLVASEVGRFLVPEPLIERLLFGALAKRLLSDASDRALFSSVTAIGVAPSLCCAGVSISEAGRVSGEITFAFGMEGAAAMVAFVPVEGGLRACLIDVAQAGVALSEASSLDLTISLTAVSLRDAAATFITREGSELLHDCFEIAKACEIAGLCRRIIEITADYVRTREQFGVPVGSFQAVQHKLADAFASAESLEALSRFAGWSVGASADQRPLTSRAAIGRACQVGPSVCEACLQCHGGIGFTWEYDLHLYLRRAKVTEAAFRLTRARAHDLVRLTEKFFA